MLVTHAFEKACQNRVASACTSLALVYERSSSPPGLEDAARAHDAAVRLLLAECASGDSGACVARAQEQLLTGKPNDEARALLEAECEKGNADACVSLAEHLLKGTPAERTTAIKVLEAACASSGTCFLLA